MDYHLKFSNLMFIKYINKIKINIKKKFLNTGSY